MSADNFERARKYRITEPWPVRPDDIFILVRVADLYTRPTAFFYIDPYRMYVSGYMRVQPEGASFAIEIQPAKPQLKLGDFSHYESSATLRGRKHQLMEPIIRFSFFSELNRRFASGLPGRHIETYMYRPLTDGHIRLLELFPGETLDDLRGTLHHVPLTHTRPYQAISYAWGFAIRPFVLKTREGVIGITASLCLGLRRLRQKKSPTLIWADAICINQNDVKEKNEQVRLMPEIFKTAERVSVWTGPEANGSSTAIDCLWRMAMSVQVGYIQMLRVPEESAVWDSINSFFKRPWFQRAWIVQEMVLAREVILMCGRESIEWNDLYVAAKVCFQKSQTSSISVMRHIGRNVSAVLSLGDLRLSYHHGEGGDCRRLLTLFDRFHHCKATLQRDKLFALLGLANDAEDPMLNPDYASPLHDIVGSTWTSTPGGFAACTSSLAQAWVSPDDMSILIAKGYVFDSIEKVSNTSYAKAGCLSYLKELSDMITEHPSYPTGESLAELKWKIPIGGLVEARSPTGEEVDFRAAYQALTEYLELGEHQADWRTEIMQIRALGKVKHFLFRPEELRKLLWPYLRTAVEFAERFVDARACRTRLGYVGIVPGIALPGDTVAMVCGSAVPFVIRESEKRAGHYILLGESYVHGIMHGTPAQAGEQIIEEIRLL
ncbi:hypothetical protein NPX13_g5680 [Xylaria arbuscula]|uniref:Heterokaryon incompatibility domain-containing protein n=1 Tax=Xylaria arbuscula TaxID=114810 RepID=A0A9W8NDK3_9PEZI|nr:hypothetical protein NPX13_g5680 [Xylaria arbuscula]